MAIGSDGRAYANTVRHHDVRCVVVRDTIRTADTVEEGDPAAPFAPASQAVLLCLLLDAERHGGEPEALARAVGYSAMSISRAARALERSGLIRRPKRGRQRNLRLVANPKTVWDRAQPHLVSPVRARHAGALTDFGDALDAGEAALSQRSLLTPPPTRTVAVSAAAWSRYDSRQADAPHPDALGEPGTVTVEVWTYPPESLSRGSAVDPLSLYLSLRDHTDERVARARDDLLAVLG